MIGSRGIVLFVVAVAFGLAVAPLASAAVMIVDDGSSADDGGDDPTPGANGSEVSTFMQSSSADADTAVEAELFEAAFEAADEDERADVVRDRIERLEARAAALEAEREALDADELNEVAYEARMTRFAVQLAALEESIEATERRAENTTGVDADGLAELRSNASELGGQEVAEIARNLAGVSPPGQSGAPSENAPGGDGSSPGEGAPGDAGSQPDDGSPGNDQSGPPDDDPETGPPSSIVVW